MGLIKGILGFSWAACLIEGLPCDWLLKVHVKRTNQFLDVHIGEILKFIPQISRDSSDSLRLKIPNRIVHLARLNESGKEGGFLGPQFVDGKIQ